MASATEVDPDWPTHVPSCACMGRGWYVEHRCDCRYMECVGCIKEYVQCDQRAESIEPETS